LLRLGTTKGAKFWKYPTENVFESGEIDAPENEYFGLHDENIEMVTTNANDLISVFNFILLNIQIILFNFSVEGSFRYAQLMSRILTLPRIFAYRLYDKLLFLIGQR